MNLRRMEERGPREGVARWLGPACLVALVVGSAKAQAFREDFDGTALDPTVWLVETRGGEVVVADGVVRLTCGPTFPGEPFPVVTSRQDPFPDGDFRVQVGMQYLSAASSGDGFGAMDNFWENMVGVACRPFLIWQDGQGVYVYSGNAGGTLLGPAPDTGYHIFEWVYMGGEYVFSMDGVVRSSGACAPRATKIFFGHPHPDSGDPVSGVEWSPFAIDFIDISPIGPTPTRAATWGRLKQVYR